MAICKHCGNTLILKGGKCLRCGKSPDDPVSSEDKPEGASGEDPKGTPVEEPKKKPEEHPEEKPTETPDDGFKEKPEERMEKKPKEDHEGKPIKFSEPSKSVFPNVRSFEINGVSFNMILVEGGTFWMGEQNLDPRKPNYDPDADGDSVRQVTVDTFYIGETVVTNDLLKALFPETGVEGPEEGERGETPIVNCGNMSYAKLIASECMAQTGEFFRIPTEEEWEFAARGGNKGKGCRFSGTNVLKEAGWYYCNRNDFLFFRKNESGESHGSIRIPPVIKKKKPNELGLYDMSGLVFEICAVGATGVYKGGCCESNSSECRIAYTARKCEGTCANYIGLRFAMTPRFL